MWLNYNLNFKLVSHIPILNLWKWLVKIWAFLRLLFFAESYSWLSQRLQSKCDSNSSQWRIRNRKRFKMQTFNIRQIIHIQHRIKNSCFKFQIIMYMYFHCFKMHFWSTRPTHSDHYFRTCCPSFLSSVPTFQKLTNQNKFQVSMAIATCASGRVDHWWNTCLVMSISIFMCMSMHFWTNCHQPSFLFISLTAFYPKP